jgi:hypothetical protein
MPPSMPSGIATKKPPVLEQRPCNTVARGPLSPAGRERVVGLRAHPVQRLGTCSHAIVTSLWSASVRNIEHVAPEHQSFL